MKVPRPQWSISTLLAILALVPALVSVAVVVATSLVGRLSDLEAGTQERGQLLAAALAESSQYGIASANREALEGTMKALIASDAGVNELQVLDADRRPLAQIRSANPSAAPLVFEAEVRAQALDVDLLDSASVPHTNSPKAGVLTGRTLGFVRVAMSTAPLEAAKRRALVQAALLSAVAAGASVALALLLAHRVRRPLQQVMAAVRQVRRGDYKVDLPVTAHGELGELQRAMGEMSSSLAQSWEQLELKVEARTAELRETMQALRASEADRRRVIAHVNRLLEEERRRLSLEIHDQLNAALIVVRLAAATLADQEGEPLSAAEVATLARQIADTTGTIYESARNIVKRLRPEVIDTLGFQGAIAEMVRTMDQLHPNCEFELRVAHEVPPLAPDIAMTAYRLVQEALSNVVKHSGARLAVVEVSRGSSAEWVRIEVRDDGCGFDVRRRAKGIGLLGMRERVEASGGTFAVVSESWGTSVAAELPSHANSSVGTAGGAGV